MKIESNTPATAGDWPRVLARACEQIETDLVARLGVSILDTLTDRLDSYRGEERFPLCSTFKAIACGAVLERVDSGQDNLDRRLRYDASDLVRDSPATTERLGEDGLTLAELCEVCITVSDNTAANLILKTMGGPEGLTKFLRSLGDQVTRLDRWEPALNEAVPGDHRDTTSPNAMAATIRKLVSDGVLSVRSRDLLTTWLIGNTTGDAKLRAGLPKDWRVGDKTGSNWINSTNDVAVIWPPQRKPIIVAMYITETATPLADCNAAFRQVGRLLTASLLG